MFISITTHCHFSLNSCFFIFSSKYCTNDTSSSDLIATMGKGHSLLLNTPKTISDGKTVVFLYSHLAISFLEKKKLCIDFAMHYALSESIQRIVRAISAVKWSHLLHVLISLWYEYVLFQRTSTTNKDYFHL